MEKYGSFIIVLMCLNIFYDTDAMILYSTGVAFFGHFFAF